MAVVVIHSWQLVIPFLLMLTLHPTLACRGRSRQVSDAALARQASEERRISYLQRTFLARGQSSIHVPSQSIMPLIVHPVPVKAILPPPFMRSASPSPPSSASMSPDNYDSPPSPPRSLEDQVHIAYALEDIHGAKILLLRLQGIEVTSDDDPRIDAIQDDDFDRFFVPNGGLMMDEKAMLERQEREMAQIEARRRMERLRNCEKKWEQEKRRMREERLAVLRRREKKRQEEDERRRRAEENERRRLAEEEQRRTAEEERRRMRRERSERATQRIAARKIVSYDHLQPSQSPARRSQFVYDFPCTTPHHPVPPQLPSFDDSTAIPFTDVLISMQGPLFPLTPDERAHSRRKDTRLLEALLVHIEQTDEERRRRKGKYRAQPRREFGPCQACSSPPLSSSLSSIPRTSSWLSFRSTSSSASSSTTDLSTPSTSPPPSSPKSAWFVSRPKSCIADPIIRSPAPLRHSCHQHTRLVHIALADSPLNLDTLQPASRSAHISCQRSTSTVRAARESAGALVRRMSKFVELAKGFQTAYVGAALLSVSASHDSSDHRDSFYDPAREDTREKVLSVLCARDDSSIRRLRPAGYRASVNDVTYFLDSVSPGGSQGSSDPPSSGADQSPPKYIPLTSPYPPTDVPHTTLPDPLPYRLIFKPIPSTCRSPFRFHAMSELHTMYPSSSPLPLAMASGQLSWRLRSVGNPVHMRLKALHNMVKRYGMEWEGAARETALGGGRERVVGVAYEGVGRSLLRRTASSP